MIEVSLHIFRVRTIGFYINYSAQSGLMESKTATMCRFYR